MNRLAAVTSTIINNFPFMVSEDQRWKEKRLHLSVQQPCKFILTKESVYIRKEFNSHRTGLVLKWWPPAFHCFATPIWANMAAICRHVHTLYALLWCVVCFLIVTIHYYFKPSDKRNEKYWHSHIFLFYFFLAKFVQFVQNQNIVKTRLVFPTKARNAEILSGGFNDHLSGYWMHWLFINFWLPCI